MNSGRGGAAHAELVEACGGVLQPRARRVGATFPALLLAVLLTCAGSPAALADDDAGAEQGADPTTTTTVETTSATDDDPPPWFTGPLLVPGAQTNGKDTLYFQPYLSGGDGLGVYNNGLSTRRTAVDTNINAQLIVAYGITDSFDVQVEAQCAWNSDTGATSFGVGDTQVELHYAVLQDDRDSWLPAVRVDYVQIFPSGNWEQLDPALNGTDGRGSGLFAPTVQLNFMKTFHLGGDHFFRPDVSFVAAAPLDRKVSGLNVYGGGQGTEGTIHPGNSLTAYFSGEFSLTRHWAVGFDSTYTFLDAVRFTGNPGINPDGTAADVGTPNGYQITFSPQIEYNFDGKQGLVFGPWFTIAGRNTEDFKSFVLSYAVAFDL